MERRVRAASSVRRALALARRPWLAAAAQVVWSGIELEVVVEGGGQLGQGQADERQGAGPGGHGADEGFGAAGDEDEHHPGRWLLEHLEEGVGGGLGHPVGLVEDEHGGRGLVVGAGGLLADGADVLDQEVVALGDDQVDVGVDAAEDAPAGVAGAVAAGRAVQGGGEHPGRVELADPGGAGEQPGVGDPAPATASLSMATASSWPTTMSQIELMPAPIRRGTPMGFPDPSRRARTAAWTRAATSGTGAVASTTAKRAGVGGGQVAEGLADPAVEAEVLGLDPVQLRRPGGAGRTPGRGRAARPGRAAARRWRTG